MVFIFQGGFVYYTCYTAITLPIVDFYPQDFVACLISSCLIGASYPLTQIYQHEEDSKRGDRTLSILLGYRGFFCFFRNCVFYRLKPDVLLLAIGRKAVEFLRFRDLYLTDSGLFYLVVF